MRSFDLFEHSKTPVQHQFSVCESNPLSDDVCTCDLMMLSIHKSLCCDGSI